MGKEKGEVALTRNLNEIWKLEGGDIIFLVATLVWLSRARPPAEVAQIAGFDQSFKGCSET